MCYTIYSAANYAIWWNHYPHPTVLKSLLIYMSIQEYYNNFCCISVWRKWIVLKERYFIVNVFTDVISEKNLSWEKRNVFCKISTLGDFKESFIRKKKKAKSSSQKSTPNPFFPYSCLCSLKRILFLFLNQNVYYGFINSCYL